MRGGGAHVDDSTAADLADECLGRFPVLRAITGSFSQEHRKREVLPPSLGLFLALCESDIREPCCVVVPEGRGMAALVAVLASLVRFRQEYPALVREYARAGIRVGQRVRVLPSDYIFTYEGVWPNYPDQFRLGEINASNFRSLPVNQVLRLEPTERVQPKGYLDTDLGKFEPAPVDLLLGLQSGGNAGIIRNRVLCMMHRSEFKRALDPVILLPRTAERFQLLMKFFPWGSVNAAGQIRNADRFQTQGQPLVAVSGTPEDHALACSLAEPGSKIVIVDGPQRLVRSPQAYDRITESQKLLIIASERDLNEARELAKRGCHLWRINPDELLTGLRRSQIQIRNGLIGQFLGGAIVAAKRKLTSTICRDERFETVAESLNRAAEMAEAEENPDVNALIGKVFGLLLAASDSCGLLTKDEGVLREVTSAEAWIARQAMFLSQDLRRELQHATAGLKGIFQQSERPSAKMAAVESAIAEMKAKGLVPIAIAMRSPRTAEALAARLNGHAGEDVNIITLASLNSERRYESIILPAWPTQRRLQRIERLYTCPHIRLLTFPFEQRWLKQYQDREAALRGEEMLAAGEKARLTGVPQARWAAVQFQPPRDTERNETARSPVFRFEERSIAHIRAERQREGGQADSRRARAVKFVGRSHAFLTEWFNVPVVSSLVRGESEGSIPLMPVDRLTEGDFVVFRDSGDANVIRALAEGIVGTGEYARQRHIARLWRDVLRRLGSDPQRIYETLKAIGSTRHFVTIRNWVVDPDMIGPRDRKDIDHIAAAAGSEELRAKGDQVWAAIVQTRALHVQAGNHLTRLILEALRGRVGRIDDEETRIALPMGDAWVVQVDEIAPEFDDYLAARVNRLLWDLRGLG